MSMLLSPDHRTKGAKRENARNASSDECDELAVMLLRIIRYAKDRNEAIENSRGKLRRFLDFLRKPLPIEKRTIFGCKIGFKKLGYFIDFPFSVTFEEGRVKEIPFLYDIIGFLTHNWADVYCDDLEMGLFNDELDIIFKTGNFEQYHMDLGTNYLRGG